MIRIFLCAMVLTVLCGSFGEKPAAVLVILDTDIGPDYDDVGALAMLHAFADRGEAKILATISCNPYETTAPTLSVINSYFGRENIPIGITSNDSPSYSCPRLWAQAIIKKYPHAIKSNADAIPAVQLYRKVLARQADHSVTIVSIGTFTNLAELLNSAPDKYSSLNGQQLVSTKVKSLVAMAGAIDSTGNSGYEYNVMADIPAAKKVIRDWPGTIVLSGLEVGTGIMTGMKLIHNDALHDSPIKDAYRISIDYDGTTTGRYSWDQTAVWSAVRGIGPLFDSRKLNFVIKDDGKDSVIAGNRITYLVLKKNADEVSNVFENLMMHQPLRKVKAIR